MGNARAAIAISNNGTNWAPWTTFSSGAYRKFLQVGVAPDTNAPINGTNAAVNQNTGTLTGDNLALSLPGGLWDPANWFLDPLGSAGSAAGGAISSAGPTLIKYFLQGLIITMLNPMLQLVAGVLGIGAGGAMVVIGIWLSVKDTQAGQAAGSAAGLGAQAAMTAVAPEASAATKYVSAGGKATTVTSTRRAAGNVNVGGRKVQYRPAQVKTTVDRPDAAPSTKQALRNEAQGYTNKKAPEGAQRPLSPTTSSTHKTYRGPGGAGGRGGSSGR
jgi:hypothetical protein